MAKPHKEIFVKVNAPVDEGIASLVLALSRIPDLITIESCQGGPQDAFVCFHLGAWQECGDFLYGNLLPALSPDMRGQVALRMQAYDTDVARAFISVDPGAVPELSEAVQTSADQFMSARKSVCSCGNRRT